jgi:cytochrome c553
MAATNKLDALARELTDRIGSFGYGRGGEDMGADILSLLRRAIEADRAERGDVEVAIAHFEAASKELAEVRALMSGSVFAQHPSGEVLVGEPLRFKLAPGDAAEMDDETRCSSCENSEPLTVCASCHRETLRRANVNEKIEKLAGDLAAIKPTPSETDHQERAKRFRLAQTDRMRQWKAAHDAAHLVDIYDRDLAVEFAAVEVARDEAHARVVQYYERRVSSAEQDIAKLKKVADAAVVCRDAELDTRLVSWEYRALLAALEEAGR